MRLQHYLLLREAKVKQTDADVFLREFAPIFLYNYEIGLLWVVCKENDSHGWEVYDNNRLVKNNLYGDLTGGKGMTHGYLLYLLGYYKKESERIYEKSIKGRISPDGKTIYIHDLENRGSKFMNQKQFERMADKVVDYVYKYMKDYIK